MIREHYLQDSKNGILVEIGNWDDTTCLDIDPDTLYMIAIDAETAVRCIVEVFRRKMLRKTHCI